MIVVTNIAQTSRAYTFHIQSLTLGGVFVTTTAITASFILIWFQTMMQHVMFTEKIVLVKLSADAVCLERLLQKPFDITITVHFHVRK